MLLHLCTHGPHSLQCSPPSRRLLPPRSSCKSRDSSQDPIQTSLPQSGPTRVSIGLQHRTCLGMTILLADKPKSVGGTPKRTSNPRCSWTASLSIPRPERARPMACLGRGKCPFGWRNAQWRHPSHRRHPPEAPTRPRRPSRASHTLPPPTPAATPLYGTHSNRCKRGRQARSLYVPVGLVSQPLTPAFAWSTTNAASSPKFTEPGDFLALGI